MVESAIKAAAVDLDQEVELVERAQSGDRDAFTALVDRYWRILRGWLTGACRDRHLAEEIAQEAFVNAWSKLPMLKDNRSFRVWLFRIARNLMLMRLRATRETRHAALPQTVADHQSGPDAEAMTAEAMTALGNAVRELAEPYRTAYLLWSQGEMAFGEVAAVLEITEENARFRVCRARQMLVKQLNAFLETPAP